MLESRHLVNKPQITVRKTIAPNSNSITQERFHSTKKKKNTARAPRMAKPTIESEKTVRDHLEGLESSVCSICYKTNDHSLSTEVQWIQCSVCALWVHQTCANIQVISLAFIVLNFI